MSTRRFEVLERDRRARPSSKVGARRLETLRYDFVSGKANDHPNAGRFQEFEINVATGWPVATICPARTLSV